MLMLVYDDPPIESSILAVNGFADLIEQCIAELFLLKNLAHYGLRVNHFRLLHCSQGKYPLTIMFNVYFEYAFNALKLKL